MNISGFARGLMAKNYCAEKFLLHVANCIEGQLKEWDENYEVILMKMQDYEFIVRKGVEEYHTLLTENDIEILKQSGPFQLDRKIWKDLENQGLPILKGFGNYLETIF